MSEVGQPLVTIGMPVRNGGALFREALASVVEQDYPNLEIIVSDNGSTDETAEIVGEFRARDPRIRYVRQEKLLTAFDNFQWVLKEARGELFAWAAHDDLRSTNFVSALVPALASRSVVLAFPELWLRNGSQAPAQFRPYDFHTCGRSPIARMRKQALMQCYHIYGLWQTSALRSVRWSYTPWWGDLPLMIATACIGEFRFVPGARFVYLEIVKTDAQRALYQDGKAAASKLGSVWGLIAATGRTVTDTCGLLRGTAATAFVIEKHVWLLLGFPLRMWRSSR